METQFVPVNQVNDAMNLINQIGNYKEMRAAHAAELQLKIAEAAAQANLFSTVTDDISSDIPIKLHTVASQAHHAGMATSARDLRNLGNAYGMAGAERSKALSAGFTKLIGGGTTANPFAPPTEPKEPKKSKK